MTLTATAAPIASAAPTAPGAPAAIAEPAAPAGDIDQRELTICTSCSTAHSTVADPEGLEPVVVREVLETFFDQSVPAGDNGLGRLFVTIQSRLSCGHIVLHES